MQAFRAEASQPLQVYPSFPPPTRSRRTWPLYSASIQSNRLSLPTIEMAPTAPVQLHSLYRKWNASTKHESAWDPSMMDHDLWLPDGDCTVYLCGKSDPAQTPAYKFPQQALRDASCEHLIDPSSLQRLHAAKDGELSHQARVKVYLPPPKHASPEELMQWQVRIRNFFAWTLGKPLVGVQLAQVYPDLLQTMTSMRAAGVDNIQDLLCYAETLGYFDFANNPVYALAALHFAEIYELKDLYVESIVHCVGMYDSLPSVRDFPLIHQRTRAIMAQKSVKMERLGKQVSKTLGNFLDEDFSDIYIGLDPSGRSHLDRFRTFLQTYHVQKFGYWPLLEDSSLISGPYRIMFSEFQNLYDYLADKTPETNLGEKPAIGGLCTLQCIEAFNSRHDIPPLMYSYPLLPEVQLQERKDARINPLGRNLIRRTSKHQSDVAWSSLCNASNPSDRMTTSCSLVQAYINFEREISSTPCEKLSLHEARKIRWLLIYGVLQMLTSVVRAPPEVRDVENPQYPLCCSTVDLIPWLPSASPLNVSQMVSTLSPDMDSASHDFMYAVQPDCETDDYLQHSRKDDSRLDQKSTRISRVPSYKSLRALSVRSLSVRRRSSTRSLGESSSVYANSASEYMDPLEAPLDGAPNLPTKSPLRGLATGQRQSFIEPSQPSAEPDTASADEPQEGNRTPLLEPEHLDALFEIPSLDASQSDSDASEASPQSPTWTDHFGLRDIRETDETSHYGDGDDGEDEHIATTPPPLDASSFDESSSDTSRPTTAKTALKRLSGIYSKSFDYFRRGGDSPTSPKEFSKSKTKMPPISFPINLAPQQPTKPYDSAVHQELVDEYLREVGEMS